MPLNLKQTILKTVLYADIFNYPLTIDETCKWLIGASVNLATIDKTVRILKENKRIGIKDGYIFLPRRADLIGLRLKRCHWSKKKTGRLEKILPLFRKIPFVRMVGITGTLSMDNADEDDDIDLLIVSERNRLWLSRLIITVLFELMGIRRHPGQEKAKDKICINMFLDADHLALLEPERDIFAAHELLQMKPIMNKGSIYTSFIRNNRWSEKYLPHAYKNINYQKSNIKNTKKKLNIFIKFSVLICNIIFYLMNFDFIERICKDLQLWYMSNRRTTEVINDGYIRFHPHDARIKVLSEYGKRLELFGFSA